MARSAEPRYEWPLAVSVAIGLIGLLVTVVGGWRVGVVVFGVDVRGAAVGAAGVVVTGGATSVVGAVGLPVTLSRSSTLTTCCRRI